MRTPTIKNDGTNSFGFGSFSRHGTDAFCGRDIGPTFLIRGKGFGARGSRRERDARLVVDELDVNILVAEFHSHPRAAAIADDLFPNPPVAQSREFLFFFDSH